MLISFKSTAAAEIIMYKEHIAAVLELLGKDIERGVITAAETASAIQQIEALIDADKKQRQLLESAEDRDADEDLDSIDKKKKNDVVTLSARLFPFLDMLRAANKKQKDVLWGV
jgi:hypothetical protein